MDMISKCQSEMNRIFRDSIFLRLPKYIHTYIEAYILYFVLMPSEKGITLRPKTIHIVSVLK